MMVLDNDVIRLDGKPIATFRRGKVLSVHGLDETMQSQIRALIDAPVSFVSFNGPAEERTLCASQQLALMRIKQRRHGY